MYIAKDEDVYVSANKTRKAALIALMEYRGAKPKEIREAIKEGFDITVVDPTCQIIETVR